MFQRLIHIFAVIAVITACLFGGDRAVLCISDDGELLLHATPVAAAVCATPQLSTNPAPACVDGECVDVEIGSVVKVASPSRDDIETLSLPVHPTVMYVSALPLSKSMLCVSGKAWSDLHAPSAPAIADVTGIRQI